MLVKRRHVTWALGLLYAMYGSHLARTFNVAACTLHIAECQFSARKCQSRGRANISQISESSVQCKASVVFCTLHVAWFAFLLARRRCIARALPVAHVACVYAELLYATGCGIPNIGTLLRIAHCGMLGAGIAALESGGLRR